MVRACFCSGERGRALTRCGCQINAAQRLAAVDAARLRPAGRAAAARRRGVTPPADRLFNAARGVPLRVATWNRPATERMNVGQTGSHLERAAPVKERGPDKTRAVRASHANVAPRLSNAEAGRASVQPQIKYGRPSWPGQSCTASGGLATVASEIA